MRKLVILGLLASLTSPVFAAPDPKAPITLARSSDWETSFNEHSCHLTATFGEGANSAIIRMTRYEPGNELDLTIYGGPFQIYGSRLSAKVRFGNEQPTQRDAVAGRSGNKLPLLILISVRLDGWKPKKFGQLGPAITPQQEAQIKAIEVTLIETRSFRFETDPLAKPMASMRDCTANLLKRWGFDPAQQLALSKLPEPLKSPANWLKDNDFPKGALGRNGLVPFRLDIDEAGKVAGCVVLLRTNPDDFADLTCALISKRAKFSPALDKSGTPVRSYFVNKVHWMSM